MNVANISAESTPKVFLKSNVVTGVLEDQSLLTAFIADLNSNGVMVVEILQGSEGLSFLDQQEHSIRGLVDFFLGDMETDMRRVYASEIHLGKVVFGIPVTDVDKDSVIAIVKKHHASSIEFFGRFIVENIESNPSERHDTNDAISQATSGTNL